MFFIASKIFWFLASPLHLSLFVAAFGLWLLARGRGGAGLVASGLGLLAVMTFLPLGAALLRPLEASFPALRLEEAAPDGIIVLGGGVDERITQARGQIQLNEAAERMTAGAALARAFPKAKLVFSGGSGALLRSGAPEADVARQLWRELGVPDERMMFEDRSRNTFENAVFTQELAHPGAGERWLLVTSAWHMPRAMAAFRAQGMDPVAFPVDFRTYGTADDWRPPGDGALALRNAETAVREWIGLIAYWLAGKTQAILPAP
ncbi:Uncharacterized SAM-binding protein YcdF, DUF218 family [Rhodoblastus acidophilus]|uniref:Uncharacterized SAM-binding protein YcdF, DUF218 family n=1 Tax=Rhodoblastus acidophilus TaxID=1074 RepID=A0A212RHJ7_RHOAC|nr:YdcF family protein [Rhodoblastus acidophilus]PPQ38038.1 hypothetical protein CKO16_11405 [Rhodoblastus acidophilus]RAI18447.1 hypothetical protein CH337_14385 [Rhodoblastus acidophilus]SNB71886.1 Uncharacterized SAM-binding protein YcdF, DUF218 family [Rhodoblastus acidophilus]